MQMGGARPKVDKQIFKVQKHSEPEKSKKQTLNKIKPKRIQFNSIQSTKEQHRNKVQGHLQLRNDRKQFVGACYYLARPPKII